tara:strand:- start:118 stop:360 length:243 start_codon:yes stop_codon:yes gene_type:complete
MSVAEAVYVETCKICEAVSKWFQRGIIEMQRGRQLSANRKLMQEVGLWNRMDKDMSFHFDTMNERTNKEYDQMLKDLENK